VQAWLDLASPMPAMPSITAKKFDKKFPEIPTLKNYRAAAPKEFWEKFPSKEIPKKIETRIDVAAFEMAVMEAEAGWTSHQRERARKAICNLMEGASAFQLQDLPPIKVANAESAFKYGEAITDSLAGFVKAGYMAGPFSAPPVARFRVNSLMAIAQRDKARPVLDMSRPEGRSFNDNINKFKVEKVSMSTARLFSYCLKEAGVAAIMSKFDMKDAYKLIPCKLYDIRLQGVSWLGMYFVELGQIFGASTSVANYDGFSETVKELAISSSRVPRKQVHKTLDDVVIVAPAFTTWTRDFSNSYLAICQQLNIPLAKDCPRHEKAFTMATWGRVLGIDFSSTPLGWRYPREKGEELISDILHLLQGGVASLNQVQVVMGRVNDLAQMLPFLSGFRRPANQLMASFQGDETRVARVPEQVKKDLAVVAKATLSAMEGLPIASRPVAPPLHYKKFTSDAAGALTGKRSGRQIVIRDPKARGVASVSMDKEGRVQFACRLTWPQHLLTVARDSEGKQYGLKTTTLEMVGLLLPFLAIPGQLTGEHVVLQVDNIAAVYGWENRQAKEDNTASILIRALHLIEARLACRIHVRHLPRLSSPEGELADHLSREATTGGREERAIKGAEVALRPGELGTWLQNPSEDWDLAHRLLEQAVSSL